jgi:UDP:flavonoid glycosyltransferase YjiC (YdhE family)
MATALFFPNYLGGGFGHIGRCLALAHAWEQRGGKAVFALNGPHVPRVRAFGYPCRTISTPRMPKPSPLVPAYVRFDSMAYQIVRDGFDHPQTVRRALKEARQIVDEVRPDVLVGDGWPLTWMAGLQTRVPVVQIVKAIANPRHQDWIWWESPPAGAVAPDPRPVFNPVLRKMGRNPISWAEELLQGDLYLLPSIPALDPLTAPLENSHYIGAMSLPREDEPAPKWMRQLDPSRPVVYLTVGGAAGHDGGGDFFRIVAAGLGNLDAQVVVSTGGKVNPDEITFTAPNIRWERWVPTNPMLERSDLVIFHGGYGTRMQVVDHGLPSIVMPFHSEQEYSGRQLERNGAGVLLPYSDEPYTRIRAKWRGGQWIGKQAYTVFLRLNATLTPENLRETVENALRNPALREGAQALQEAAHAYGGCEQAVALIEGQLL